MGPMFLIWTSSPARSCRGSSYEMQGINKGREDPPSFSYGETCRLDPPNIENGGTRRSSLPGNEISCPIFRTIRSVCRLKINVLLVSALCLALSGCMQKIDTDKLPDESQRQNVNALLLSATTNPGQKSLEHAKADIAKTFGSAKRILLINYASLPDKRDAYEERMKREFAKIGPGYAIESLHAIPAEQRLAAVQSTEGFYVSGGNTFLLLRELYNDGLVTAIRERALQGTPYIGSSAGSNIAGQYIGTTNDFPITDVPTRRSLGLMAANFNPHHPDQGTEEAEFGSRQYKIGEYVAYNRDEVVIGITNRGMLRIQGNTLSLRGKGAAAYISYRGENETISSEADGEISRAIDTIRQKK